MFTAGNLTRTDEQYDNQQLLSKVTLDSCHVDLKTDIQAIAKKKATAICTIYITLNSPLSLSRFERRTYLLPTPSILMYEFNGQNHLWKEQNYLQLLITSCFMLFY